MQLNNSSQPFPPLYSIIFIVPEGGTLSNRRRSAVEDSLLYGRIPFLGTLEHIHSIFSLYYHLVGQLVISAIPTC